jgi:hypothetical protein
MARLEFECTCNTEDRDGTPTSSRQVDSGWPPRNGISSPCIQDDSMFNGHVSRHQGTVLVVAVAVLLFVFCSCSSRCLKLLISRRKFYNINKSFIDRARRCFVHCSAKPLLDAWWRMWPPCAICAPCVSCLARSWLARRIPRARTFYMLLYELNYSLTF